MKLEHEEIGPNLAPEEYFKQMGRLALLVGTTDTFRRVQMDVGLSMIHAALKNRTCALYLDGEGKPAAGLIWAYLDEENAEVYLEKGVLPTSSSWRSGSQLWLMHFVAEGGLARRIFTDLRKNTFRNEKEAFMLRPSPDGTRRVVRITHSGSKVIRTLPKIQSS